MREWLLDARTERKMTMKDLAEKLGISESYYCMIEKGERQKKMDLWLMGAISTALDIPPADIIEKEVHDAKN